MEVDEQDVEKEASSCVYDVIGEIAYKKGDKPLSIPEMKTKLPALWKIENFDIAHIGKGFYHVFLKNIDHQSKVLSTGTQNLKPGFFRVSH